MVEIRTHKHARTHLKLPKHPDTALLESRTVDAVSGPLAPCYKKTGRENANDDNWIKQYFPRAHTETRREPETGFDHCKSQKQPAFRGEREINSWLGPGNSCKEGLQTKQKHHHSLSTPACALFLISCRWWGGGVKWFSTSLLICFS